MLDKSSLHLKTGSKREKRQRYSKNETRALFHFLYVNECLDYMGGVKVFHEFQKYQILPSKTAKSNHRHVQYYIKHPIKLKRILDKKVFQAVKSAIKEKAKNKSSPVYFPKRLRHQIQDQYVFNEEKQKFERIDDHLVSRRPIKLTMYKRSDGTLCKIIPLHEPVGLAPIRCTLKPLSGKPKTRGADYTVQETKSIFEYIFDQSLGLYMKTSTVARILQNFHIVDGKSAVGIKKHILRCIQNPTFLQQRIPASLFRQVQTYVKYFKTHKRLRMPTSLRKQYLC